MAAPVVATTSSAVIGTASVTGSISAPASIAAGDLIVIAARIAGNSGDITITPPSGFTEVSDPLIRFSVSTSRYYTKVWAKVAGASEPGTYTATASYAATWRMTALRITGAKPVIPAIGVKQANATSTTTHLTPGFTTTETDTLAILTLMTLSTMGTVTQPAGFDEHYDDAAVFGVWSDGMGAPGVKALGNITTSGTTPSYTAVMQIQAGARGPLLAGQRNHLVRA